MSEFDFDFFADENKKDNGLAQIIQEIDNKSIDFDFDKFDSVPPNQ